MFWKVCTKTVVQAAIYNIVYLYERQEEKDFFWMNVLLKSDELWLTDTVFTLN